MGGFVLLNPALGYVVAVGDHVDQDPEEGHRGGSARQPGLVCEDARLPARVLIVDDAPVFREAARELLERRGYNVIGEADSAASAIEAVEKLAPDAVLADIRLPDGDGFELSSALTRAHPELAVLLTSADRVPPTPERVGASGARGFVLKTRLAATDLSQFLPGT